MKNKKILSFIGLGCAALVLTGCGNSRKVTCTCEEKDDGATMFGSFVFYYDKEWKEIEKVDYELGYEIHDKDEYDIDDFKESLEEQCDSDDAPSDCKVKVKGNKATLNATGTADDFGIDKDMTKEEIFDEMENEECSCK